MPHDAAWRVYEYDINDGTRTPPLNVQGHYEEIPLAVDLEVFRHVDVFTTFLLRETKKSLYDDANKWFKARVITSTELTIAETRKTHLQEDWILDLLYDRLNLLRTGLNPKADESTYTSFWQEAQSRRKGYKIVCIIVFGYDISIYHHQHIKYLVGKVFQDKYHVRRDVYLAKLLVHLKICLTIKTIMENNWDVCVEFVNSIESTEKDEQAHFNLKNSYHPYKGPNLACEEQRTRIQAATL
ncbi:MAG: hypothetical protein J3R72DRAFT_493898 [Linnemannia gamsii]|nr:MAG: hypothetical protein J3R72DRAFT_493898 [Linnemannia gamsii]